MFVVVYGLTEFPDSVPILRYRTTGLPDGIEAYSCNRIEHGRYLRESFEEGEIWQQLVANDPELSQAVLRSPGTIIFRGEPESSHTLLYLRDVIGMTACLADHGAIAIYEPFTFRWWSAEAWKQKYFSEDRADPQSHVMIYYSTEQDGLWLHTRGLRTFGRPDLSVRGVHASDLDAAFGMCNALIDYQAFGGVLAEGQRVRDPVLGAYEVRHQGDSDDVEFNNSHIELLRR